MMPTPLAQYQQRFAQYVREPVAANLAPGLQPDRMDLYRELMFNNVSSIVQACFPVTRKVLHARTWQALLRRFFAQRRCATPYFRELPQEFVDWLFDQGRPPLKSEPAYLPFLAHYEWLELAVDTHPDDAAPLSVLPWQDGPHAVPVLEPSLRLACYPYPVHAVGPDQREVPMQTTWLMVWRNELDRVRFAQINQASFVVLQALQAQSQSCAQLAHTVQEALRAGASSGVSVSPEQIVSLMRELGQMGVVRGVRQACAQV